VYQGIIIEIGQIDGKFSGVPERYDFTIIAILFMMK